MQNQTAGKHWLAKYRKEHGMSVDAMAKYLTRRTRRTVSVALIAILEGGGVTHPNIAARIVKITGATGAEYDRIVAKCHRGKYVKRREANSRKEKERNILAIDKNGNIAGEYSTFVEASKANGRLTSATVAEHCREKRLDNFIKYSYAYRMREDFTPEERARLMRIAWEQTEPIADCTKAGLNDVVEANGEAHTMREWGRLLGEEPEKLIYRLSVGIDPDELLRVGGMRRRSRLYIRKEEAT